jgi:hypothetical protein
MDYRLHYSKHKVLFYTDFICYVCIGLSFDGCVGLSSFF